MNRVKGFERTCIDVQRYHRKAFQIREEGQIKMGRGTRQGQHECQKTLKILTSGIHNKLIKELG